LRGQTQPAGRIYSSQFPLVPAGQPVALPPFPRHPQGAGSGRFEPTTFDYIMTKGLGSPRADLIDVPEEASDHRPVMLEILLSGP
jgi:hypothetical protein